MADRDRGVLAHEQHCAGLPTTLLRPTTTARTPGQRVRPSARRISTAASAHDGANAIVAQRRAPRILRDGCRRCPCAGSRATDDVAQRDVGRQRQLQDDAAHLRTPVEAVELVAQARGRDRGGQLQLISHAADGRGAASGCVPRRPGCRVRHRPARPAMPGRKPCRPSNASMSASTSLRMAAAMGVPCRIRVSCATAGGELTWAAGSAGCRSGPGHGPGRPPSRSRAGALPPPAAWCVPGAASPTEGRLTSTLVPAPRAAASARRPATSRSLAALRLLRPASASISSTRAWHWRTTSQRHLRRSQRGRLTAARACGLLLGVVSGARRASPKAAYAAASSSAS